jgi:hypothetical protein
MTPEDEGVISQSRNEPEDIERVTAIPVAYATAPYREMRHVYNPERLSLRTQA